MSLVKCPECDNEISDKALMCPQCGLALGGRAFGYEYRSQKKLFGLPLVHIVLGLTLDPVTGRLRVAKGIIAIGNIAVGAVALGGIAFGLIGVGGMALGLAAALGGMAVGGLLAIGGMAVGFIAIGGAAFGYYALGGGAWGVHCLGGNAQDPKAIDFFKRCLGPWVEKLAQK
jgi:hypothetical protein